MYLRVIYVQTASQYFIFISCRIRASFFNEEFETYLQNISIQKNYYKAI
jgi:hypothetical protein